MRALAWFLAAIAGTLVIAALLGYPAYLLTQQLNPDWAFHKVVSRLWQLLMLAGIALCVWRLGLRGRDDWGWGLPRPRFLRQAGLGLLLGIATMLPMALAIVALGIRAPRAVLDAEVWIAALAGGAATGLAVALIEETFFRGLMFRAVARESGVRIAILATALLYSAIHFLARSKIPADEVGWDSGLALLSGVLARYADFAGIADAFLTLFLVGLLLGIARHWTGSIAAGMGLHMGWVWVIKFTTATTAGTGPEAPWAWLVSRFDGFTGWGVAAWSALLLALLWLTRERWQGWRSGNR